METKTKFDRASFLREVKVFVLVAVFIFALAALNLFTQTMNFVLSLQTMETTAYLEYFDQSYNKNNNDAIKETISRLENDESSPLKKQIYILDREDSTIISTSSKVDQQIADELTAQNNDLFIFFGKYSCRTADLDHYKVLVKVDVLPVYQQFMEASAIFAIRSLIWLGVVILILAILRLNPLKLKKLNTIAGAVIMFCFIVSFATQAAETELNQFDTFVDSEAVTLISDVDYAYNGEYSQKNLDPAYLETLFDRLHESTISIEDIKLNNADSLTGDNSNSTAFDIANNIEIIPDYEAIDNEKLDFYLQAGLMFLLAFVLVYEFYKVRRTQREEQNESATLYKQDKVSLPGKQSEGAEATEVPEVSKMDAKMGAQACAKTGVKAGTSKKKSKKPPSLLTKDDNRIKSLLAVIGVATAGFGIVNVLRIQEIVLRNWTEDTALIISAIFTATTIVTIAGSLFASAIFKKFGSVKIYIIAISLMGLIGSVLCGISDSPVIFIIGLMIATTAIATIRLTGDFYTTLIDDEDRKDECYMELDSGKSIGEVVGTISGGVVSAIASYAFVQVSVGVVFLAVIFYALKLKSSSFVLPKDSQLDIEKGFASFKKVLKCKNARKFLLCVVITGSIPYMLIEYKLPLDIAALGYSAIMLSFIKVVLNVIQIYSTPLYIMVDKRFKPFDHAIIYRLLCVPVLLIYFLSGSLIGIFIAVVLSGFLDGSGIYAVRKVFRDLPELASIPESDRLVVYNALGKVGDTVSPTILSTVSNPFILSAIVFVPPLLYFIWVKRKKECDP